MTTHGVTYLQMHARCCGLDDAVYCFAVNQPPEVTRVGRVLAAHADTPPPRQVRLHRHSSSNLLLMFQPVRHRLRHSSSRQQTVVESWSSSTLPEEGCVSATGTQLHQEGHKDEPHQMGVLADEDAQLQRHSYN